MGRRHSRAWWRRYRARIRRQRAALRRKRELQAQMRGESLNVQAERAASAPVATSHNNLATAGRVPQASREIKPVASASSLPTGWSRRAGANGETKFLVSASDGQYVGAATLSLVNAQATGETNVTGRLNRRMIGGVLFSDLRRSVIDKMVGANGWVVNDIQREVGGRPVFVVIAQTAASSDGRTPQLSWAFYFMEVDGRIYSLATSSLFGSSDRLADDAARFIATFRANGRAIAGATSPR